MNDMTHIPQIADYRRKVLGRARMLTDQELALIDQEQINKHVEQDRIRLDLVEGVREVSIEFGGPREGSYVSKNAKGWYAGVWNGQMYEDALCSGFREALDLALSEDLDGIRHINRARERGDL